MSNLDITNQKIISLTSDILKSNVPNKLSAISVLHGYCPDTVELDDVTATFLVIECIKRDMILFLEDVINFYIIPKGSNSLLAMVFAIPDKSPIWPSFMAKAYIKTKDRTKKELIHNLLCVMDQEDLKEFQLELASYGCDKLDDAPIQLVESFNKLLENDKSSVFAKKIFEMIECGPDKVRDNIKRISIEGDKDCFPSYDEFEDGKYLSGDFGDYDTFRDELINDIDKDRVTSVVITVKDQVGVITISKTNFI